MDKDFFEQMILASKTNIIKQEAVIAFCEMCIRKLQEEKNAG